MAEAAKTRYIPAIEIAAAHAGFEDRGQTLTWLERALEERSIHLFYLPVDPRYRWLHSDLAFQAILARLGRPASK